MSSKTDKKPDATSQVMNVTKAKSNCGDDAASQQRYATEYPVFHNAMALFYRSAIFSELRDQLCASVINGSTLTYCLTWYLPDMAGRYALYVTSVRQRPLLIAFFNAGTCWSNFSNDTPVKTFQDGRQLRDDLRYVRRSACSRRRRGPPPELMMTIFSIFASGSLILPATFRQDAHDHFNEPPPRCIV